MPDGVDPYRFSTQPSNLNATQLAKQYDADGIHPNDAGHAVIHDRIVGVINGGQCVSTAPP